jgi:hypothetical protein
MPLVLLSMLSGVTVAAVAFLVAMFVKDKPRYGATGLCILLGPGTVLTFTYLALTATGS